MKKALLALLIIALTVPAFAGTSTTFVNSVEVFGDGGGDAASTNFILHGKARGMGYAVHSSDNFRFGDGYTNSIFFGGLTRPTIYSINPTSAYNSSPVYVTISGMNFFSGAITKLSRIGQTPLLGESITVVNSGRINCTFGITNKTVGSWNVEVINPDGTICTLESGFAVLTPPKPVDVIGSPVNTPNPFNPDAGPTTIKYELNESSPIDLYIYNISGTRIWENHYPPTVMGGKQGVNEVLWTGYNAFSEKIPNGIYIYQISTGGRTLATGKIAVFK